MVKLFHLNFLPQIFLALVIFLRIFSQPVLATVSETETVVPPEFPSCVNPQGELIVSYTNGIHGVPGDTNAYEGKDDVYKISDVGILQCLCTVNGSGIQTNWWRISSMKQSEIELLKLQGWIFIPDGSLWGLDPVTYLAKNVSYSCGSTGGGGGGGTGGGGGSSGSGGGSSSGGVSSIGDILGLAATGNILTIYSLFLVGLVSLTFGVLLQKKNSK